MIPEPTKYKSRQSQGSIPMQGTSIVPGDVGSRMTADLMPANAFTMNADAAASLARAAASREGQIATTR